MSCPKYKLGCTCGPCHERYIKEHANSCTYGTALEIVEAAEPYVAAAERAIAAEFRRETRTTTHTAE